MWPTSPGLGGLFRKQDTLKLEPTLLCITRNVVEVITLIRFSRNISQKFMVTPLAFDFVHP